jgi:hypothetical protein
MKKLIIIILNFVTACTSTETKKELSSTASFVDETVITTAIDGIKASQTVVDPVLLEKGVKHAA